MAKVTGPLMSLEARGKIGNAMVHFPWKGRAVVRRWLKPTNPRDIDQKLIRQKVAAIGKAISKITTPGSVLANGAAICVAVKAKTPATQIWNAYLVKKALDGMTTDASYVAEISAIVSAADTSNIWGLCAAALDLAEITGDAFATTIPAVDQLAIAAWGAYKMEMSDASNIYSTHPSTWTTAMISQFASDFSVAY